LAVVWFAALGFFVLTVVIVVAFVVTLIRTWRDKR